MGLQSIDVQVVAINDPTMTLDDMVNTSTLLYFCSVSVCSASWFYTIVFQVKGWKSSNIRIAKKDHQTLIFEKMYYDKDTSVNVGQKIKVNVLLEQMEVTVFRYGMTSSVWLLGFLIWMFCWNTRFLHSREQNQVPWEQVNVEFVVECNALFNNDKVDVQSWYYWISCFHFSHCAFLLNYCVQLLNDMLIFVPGSNLWQEWKLD